VLPCVLITVGLRCQSRSTFIAIRRRKVLQSCHEVPVPPFPKVYKPDLSDRFRHLVYGQHSLRLHLSIQSPCTSCHCFCNIDRTSSGHACKASGNVPFTSPANGFFEGHHRHDQKVRFLPIKKKPMPVKPDPDSCLPQNG
jgi:hypothetical protein